MRSGSGAGARARTDGAATAAGRRTGGRRGCRGPAPAGGLSGGLGAPGQAAAEGGPWRRAAGAPGAAGLRVCVVAKLAPAAKTTARGQATGAATGPLAELGFWGERAADLAGVEAQLGTPAVARMAAALEATRSTHAAALARSARSRPVPAARLLTASGLP